MSNRLRELLELGYQIDELTGEVIEPTPRSNRLAELIQHAGVRDRDLLVAPQRYGMEGHAVPTVNGDFQIYAGEGRPNHVVITDEMLNASRATSRAGAPEPFRETDKRPTEALPQKLGERVQGRTGKMGRYSEDQRSIVYPDGGVEDLFPNDTAKKLKQWFEHAGREQALQKGELSWQLLEEQLAGKKAERARKEAEPVGWAFLEKFYGKPPEGMRWTADGTPEAIPGYETGAKLTESQGKALSFGSRAASSSEILESVGESGRVQPNLLKRTVEAVPFVGGALGMAANKIPSFGPGFAPDSLGGPTTAQQQVEQAERDFINAVLRRESGAVISPAEFANARLQYFPQPGDTPQVIAQKKANRKTVIESLAHEAGPARRKVLHAGQKARVISDAMRAAAQGRNRAMIRERLQGMGIDPAEAGL